MICSKIYLTIFKKKVFDYAKHILNSFVENSVTDRVAEIKNEYCDAIKKLSQYDPIIAFQLTGMEKILDDIEKNTSILTASVSSLFDDDPQIPPQQIIQKIFNYYKKNSITKNNTLLKEKLSSVVLWNDVTLYIRLRFLFFARQRLIKADKNRIADEMQASFNDLLNKSGVDNKTATEGSISRI